MVTVLIITAVLAAILARGPRPGAVLAFSTAAHQHGHNIVLALGAYHLDHGQFPPSLIALAPHYLVTPPPRELSWHYEPGTNHFVLSIDVSRERGPGWRYECRADGRWRFIGP